MADRSGIQDPMAVATCPRCGTRRPPDAMWLDLCPACLLQAALSSEEEVCPYQVLAPMDEDARGTTYLAQALTRARGYVALKIYAAEVGADAALERYRQWRPALDACRHPHVRGLIDVGLTADRRLYAASEYIVGSTLPTLDRRLFSASDAGARLHLAHQLVDAVDHIHAAGLAHLALEPTRVKIASANGPQSTIIGLGVRLVVDGAPPRLDQDLVALADLIRGLRVGLPDRTYDDAEDIRGALRREAGRRVGG